MTGYPQTQNWQRDEAAAPSGGAGVDAGYFLKIFLRRWPIIIAAVFISALIGFAVCRAVTPRYTGIASLLIDPKTPGSIGPGTDYGTAITVDSSKIGSVASIIQSDPLLERVVASQKLDADPEFGAVAPGALSKVLAELGLQKSEKIDSVALAVARLRKATTVTREGVTYVIDVAVSSREPVKAARLAQAVTEAYLSDQVQAKRDASARAAGYLGDRLEQMRKEVIRSEEAVSEIRQKYGLTATDQAGTVASQKITALNTAIAAAETEISRKQSVVEQVRRVKESGGNLEGLPEVMASSVIVALRTQQTEILKKLAEMQSLPSQGGYASVRLLDSRRAIEGQISAEVARIISNLENDYAASRSNVMTLKAELKNLTGADANADGQAKLREAQSVADANRSAYAASLTKLKEFQQIETMQEPEARIIESAHVPEEASFPRLPVFLLSSLGLGLALGLGMALVAERFSPKRMRFSTFLTPMQIEENLSLPVLSSVPLIKTDDEQEDTQFQILHDLVSNQFSFFAESLRSIRFALRRTDGRESAKVIQITSAVPGEGKSSLAATLALSAAFAGEKVVLIDCDLRRPMATKLFHLSNKPGLSELIDGRAQWSEVANVGPSSLLTVVPVGKHVSPDKIGSQSFIDAVNFAAKHYDLVILDSPPILPVSEASVISRIIEQTILVIEWNKTDRDLVTQAINKIAANRGHITGVVLNKVDLTTIRTYGPNYSKYFTSVEKYYAPDKTSGALD